MEMLNIVNQQVGDGYGSGSGDGYGSGYGFGYGSSSGYGFGYGSGCGDGDGSGCGNGSGYGSGRGSGRCSDNGRCNGDGDGYGSGSGYGDGDGSGITEFDGIKGCNIDGVPTFIEAVFGDYAKGFTLQYNSVKVPCYVAHVDGHLAHGSTLREAVAAAHEKAMSKRPIEERIIEVVKQYPDPDIPIRNRELFQLHHVLTGSCEFGRRQFCEANGIDLDGSTTMREFCHLTCEYYGGEVIRQLKDEYGI